MRLTNLVDSSNSVLGEYFTGPHSAGVREKDKITPTANIPVLLMEITV